MVTNKSSKHQVLICKLPSLLSGNADKSKVAVLAKKQHKKVSQQPIPAKIQQHCLQGGNLAISLSKSLLHSGTPRSPDFLAF